MIYDPSSHTLEFLIENPEVALELAQKSEEFATSALASNRILLAVNDESNRSVAQVLGLSSRRWAQSEIAKDFEVLKMRGLFGATVAHGLAAYNPDWINSAAASSKEILELRDNSGDTVAHSFAYFNPDFLNKIAANDTSLLLLKNKAGDSVAFTIINRFDFNIDHECFFKKEILTIEHEDKMLAELIFDIYSAKHKVKTSELIVKLIEQGAAYKHSAVLGISTGKSILKNTKILIDDCPNKEISLRYALALYSTCFHAHRKCVDENDEKYQERWQEYLARSEDFVRELLNEYEYLYETNISQDFNCEPGSDLLAKIKSEKNLSINLDIPQDQLAQIQHAKQIY